MHLRPGSSLGIATAFFAATAVAQPGPADKALAQTLFRDARALMTAGKVAEACPKFAESDRLDPEIGTHLNLALCHETIGKVASAWVEFGEVADQADRIHDDERGKFARSHAESLEKRLARVRFHVDSSPADLVLEVDGAPLAHAALETAVPLDPGPHELRAEAPKKAPRVQTFEVPSSAGTTDVNVPALEAASTSTGTSAGAGTAGNTGGGLRTAGFVVGGVGLAGVVLGGIFGGLTIAQNDTANANCPFNNGSGCNQTGVDAGKTAGTFATISTVGFIAGAACLAAGVVFIIIGKPKETSPKVGIIPSLTGAAVRGTF